LKKVRAVIKRTLKKKGLKPKEAAQAEEEEK